jgi:hypothetical protein
VSITQAPPNTACTRRRSREWWCAAGDAEALDGRTKPRTPITRTKNKLNLAAPRIGVVRIRSASTSRERALSNLGARHRFGVSRLFAATALKSRRCAVPKALSGISHRGGPITLVIQSTRTGSFERRRGVANYDRANVDVPGYSCVSAIIRSPRVGSSPGRARLARCAGPRRHQVGQSIASVSRRLAGSPSRRGSFGRRGWAKAHFGSGCHAVGSRRTAACLTCHRVGRRQRGTATRRFAGHSNVPALARVFADDRSFERPSNNGLEPSRPLSCAIMSPWRAAQTAR